jgi:poly-beta-1,6 N-acetyl-D-glucosamine synthase
VKLKGWHKTVIGVVAIVLALVLVVFAYNEILLTAWAALKALNEQVIVFAVAIYLIFFLCLLILRYMLLLIYSYLEHLDHIESDHQDDPNPLPKISDGPLPLISIVVPAYNEGVVIRQALEALLELDYPNYEVIVVNDGSSDDTAERALDVARTSTRVPVRVINKPNGGKADALNVGMSRARGEFILNMDGDTKLSKNALRACLQHFDDPHLAAVAGNIKVINRENTLTHLQALEYVEGLAMVRQAQSLGRVVNIIPGPLGMFRRSALMDIGGYDHDTFAEDCDLTLKLLMRGWHVVYEQNAIAWVESPSRWLDLLKQRYRWTRGILQAIRKHRWALWHPRQAGINTAILWYMLFEGALWPISNVLGNVFFVYVGLTYGIVKFLFFWWLMLTLLDMIAAAYCVIIEKEDVALIGYAVLFRLYYILIVDVAKVFAAIEEWRGTKMTWGKLQREGKL